MDRQRPPRRPQHNRIALQHRSPLANGTPVEIDSLKLAVSSTTTPLRVSWTPSSPPARLEALVRLNSSARCEAEIRFSRCGLINVASLLVYPRASCAWSPMPAFLSPPPVSIHVKTFLMAGWMDAQPSSPSISGACSRWLQPVRRTKATDTNLVSHSSSCPARDESPYGGPSGAVASRASACGEEDPAEPLIPSPDMPWAAGSGTVACAPSIPRDELGVFPKEQTSEVEEVGHTTVRHEMKPSLVCVSVLRRLVAAISGLPQVREADSCSGIPV